MGEGLPVVNLISAPTYMLQSGVPTMDKYDWPRFRGQVRGVAQLLRNVEGRPAAEIRGATKRT